MMRKSARRLQACGIKVPVDVDGNPAHRIEIDPCYAISPEELREKLPSDFSVDGDVLLCDTE